MGEGAALGNVGKKNTSPKDLLLFGVDVAIFLVRL